ncbi:hypothetical protein [Saccharicrinis aurantiacus]|uniref:hypothetical protein n=1 Tax=Saccharicrinis aurantiacus TaxID=1849719 RepID=UPI00094F7749|nr:hypothetical protein [Saccharicrinis aurantiacus]
MEQAITQNSKKFFRTLSLIHLAMLIGQVVFLVIVLNLKLTSGKVSTGALSAPFSYIVAGLTVSCIIVCKIVYAVKLKQAQSKEAITEKMAIFQSANIIRFALYEGPSLFSIVVFLLTGELYFLIFTSILLLFFIFSKPSRQKTIDVLDLNQDEIVMIYNDDAIIFEAQTGK